MIVSDSRPGDGYRQAEFFDVIAERLRCLHGSNGLETGEQGILHTAKI